MDVIALQKIVSAQQAGKRQQHSQSQSSTETKKMGFRVGQQQSQLPPGRRSLRIFCFAVFSAFLVPLIGGGESRAEFKDKGSKKTPDEIDFSQQLPCSSIRRVLRCRLEIRGTEGDSARLDLSCGGRIFKSCTARIRGGDTDGNCTLTEQPPRDQGIFDAPATPVDGSPTIVRPTAEVRACRRTTL